jgi:hypothetical protein
MLEIVKDPVDEEFGEARDEGSERRVSSVVRRITHKSAPDHDARKPHSSSPLNRYGNVTTWYSRGSAMLPRVGFGAFID